MGFTLVKQEWGPARCALHVMTARGLKRGRVIPRTAAGRRFLCGLPDNDTAHRSQKAGDSCWLGFHQYSSYFQPKVKRRTFHTVENNYIFMHVNRNRMWKICEESGFKFERGQWYPCCSITVCNSVMLTE